MKHSATKLKLPAQTHLIARIVLIRVVVRIERHKIIHNKKITLTELAKENVTASRGVRLTISNWGLEHHSGGTRCADPVVEEVNSADRNLWLV